MTGCQLRCVTAVIVAVSATALLASPDRAGRQTTAANDQARDSRPIPLATGSGVTALSEPRRPVFGISSYGAVSKGPALANQKAINDAIAAAAAAGGGTVVVPAGDFKTYTIRLRGRVGLHFATRQSIVRAAVHGPAPQGDGGVYDAPEQNLFVGLQDHGHGHWANSLIYGWTSRSIAAA
jgi:polygalacturonase